MFVVMKNSAKLCQKDKERTFLHISLAIKTIRGKAGVQTVWKVNYYNSPYNNVFLLDFIRIFGDATVCCRPLFKTMIGAHMPADYSSEDERLFFVLFLYIFILNCFIRCLFPSS